LIIRISLCYNAQGSKVQKLGIQQNSQGQNMATNKRLQAQKG